MPATERTFDQYLGAVPQGELKSIARAWGVRSAQAAKKDELIAAIRGGLADPARARAAVEQLTPFEAGALALMRWAAAPVEAVALCAALRAGGVPLPKPRHTHELDAHLIVQPLIRHSIVLNLSLQNPASPGSSYERAVLFSDARLLAHAGPFQPEPLDLAPADPPEYTLVRRAPAIALDIAQAIQAVQSLDSLALTRQGQVRVADLRRLSKALGWPVEQLDMDGLRFPQPILALLGALEQARLLARNDQELFASADAAGFGVRPYAEQVRELLVGFTHAVAWVELPDVSLYYHNADRFAAGRLALLVALRALPEGDAFFTLESLEQALFARIGERFSLYYDISPPYIHYKDPQAVREAEQRWRKQIRDSWLVRERRWITAALTTWLYYLGVVELGLAGGEPVSFRLTALGRAALAPEAAPQASPAGGGPAWLVQPDFELLVYLDHAAPHQIAFVERHAERIQAQAHVARYRLTRDSVYQGLESGTPIDELLSGLRDGAGHDLPQNVLATVRDWAAQRERIALRLRAQIVEFADPDARQVALARGISGTPVGDRYILLTGHGPLPPHTTIDYTLDLPRCLSASEEGALRLARPAADLLLRPQLGQWAEPQPDGSWQLTQASVSQALRGGGRIAQLFGLLQARLTHALPPLLGVVLRAWGGKPAEVALAQVTVLRCTDPVAFAALAASELLRPYLLGALAPDTLLVDARHLPELRERLAWTGLDVTGAIRIVEL